MHKITKKFYRNSVLLIGCALTLGLCILAYAAEGAGTITVEAIGGPADGATLEHLGKKTVLNKGDVLVEGDRIETGTQSAIDIRLTDDSLVRIGVNSSYQLESDKQGLVQRLLAGITRVLVPETKSGAHIRFRMNTPAGTIGVRGTEFIVQHKAHITTVYGLKGEVLFGTNQDFSDISKFMVVTKSYASEIKEGNSRPSQPKPYNTADILKKINAEGFAPLKDRQAGAVIPRQASPEAKLGENVSAQHAEILTSPGGIVPKNQGSSGATGSASSSQDPNEDLIDAAAIGSLDGIKNALADGADVKKAKVLPAGDGVLHVAAVGDHLDAIQYLIDTGKADVNAANAQGQTPLMRAAAEAEKQDTVLLLLQNGADSNLKDKSGLVALDYAKKNKNIPNMAAFLQNAIKSKH